LTRWRHNPVRPEVSKDRAELVEAWVDSSSAPFGEVRCRSVAAAGDLLFFASPKKPKEKKGELKSGGLLGSDANFAAVRSTAPCGRAFGSANLDSDPKNQAACRVLKRFRPLADAERAQAAMKIVAPHEQNLPRIRSRPFPQNPCDCAEERSFKRIRASDCLSEASSSSTPLEASTAGCPQRSGGTQAPGSPFFCLLFFGEAKKSESPAAATERHRTHQRTQRATQTKASTGSARTASGMQGFDRRSPNGTRRWLQEVNP
jgi:hypothetical protein